MRKSTLIHSFITAGFAASTLYLAVQLHGRNDAPTGNGTAIAAESNEKPGSSGQLGGARDAAARPAATSSTLASSGAASTPASSAGTSKADHDAETNLYYAKQQYARLNDPVQRAAALNQARADFRRQYAHLRDKLKLSDATFEQLVTLMAEQSLESQDVFVRCAIEPGCNAEEYYRLHPVDDHAQEMLALLGAENVDALTKYQASLGEREAVAQLRGRLSESNAIRDEQAEALVLALMEERNLLEKDAAARGVKLNGLGSNGGMVFYSEDGNSFEQHMAEASQYSQRLRQRASGVLTPAQLAAFNQMQDEALAMMAAFMRPASTADKQRV